MSPPALRAYSMVDTTDCTGKGLTDLLVGVLEKNDLDINNIVGQGYDGGSKMSGINKGVQARIMEQNPAALFTHCYCHSLNRALINSVSNKDNSQARDFLVLSSCCMLSLKAVLYVMPTSSSASRE